MMAEDHGIRHSMTDRVATIVIDRADIRNSLDTDSVEVLVEAFGASQSASCIVLRSEGSSFCSGGNLQHLAKLGNRPDEIRSSIESGFQKLVRTIRDSAIPVIVRVQGPAVGAGADIALACDLRVASEEAWIQEAWINLGLVSALGAPVNLTMSGGPGFALDMLLSARKVDAQECLRLGLFQRVVPLDQLDEELDSVVTSVVEKDRDAVIAMKELVASTYRASFESGLHEGLDFQEQLMRSSAFIERVGGILDRIRSKKSLK